MIKPGYSRKQFDANVRIMIDSGHTRESAIWTAAALARKTFFRRYPQGALETWLAWPKNFRLARYYDEHGEPVTSIRNNPRKAKAAPLQAGAQMRFEGKSADGLVSGFMPVTVIAPHSNADRVTHADNRGREYEGAYSHLATATVQNARGKIFEAYHHTLHDEMRDNPRPSKTALARATKLYKNFTGKSPRTMRALAIPDAPKVGLAIGTVLGIIYQVQATGERFKHEFSSKARPSLIVADDGHQVFLRGGAYTFTERGFVDSK